MEIRLCEEHEIEEVGKFYDKVVYHLCNTINYPQWEYKKYPSEDSAREKIMKKQQFVCMDQGTIAGVFVFNEDPEGKYENANWSVELKEGEYMVCHALATDLSVRGKGIGKKMVEFCIEYAKSRGYKAIRLDAVPGNTPAKQLYEKCGFQYRGDVDLERGIDYIPVFSMYELVF